jgi:hypothetical protein
MNNTPYTIPTATHLLVTDGSLGSALMYIRDVSSSKREDLEQHFNDLYYLFLSQYAAITKTPTIDSEDEEKYVHLLKELFRVKRSLSEK